MRAIVRRVVTFAFLRAVLFSACASMSRPRSALPNLKFVSDCVQALIAESHVTADDFWLICRSTQQIAATFEVRPCAQLCGES